jgi:hypothetical protein
MHAGGHQAIQGVTAAAGALVPGPRNQEGYGATQRRPLDTLQGSARSDGPTKGERSPACRYGAGLRGRSGRVRRSCVEALTDHFCIFRFPPNGRFLHQGTNDLSEVVPLPADLLSIPTGDRYPPLNLTTRNGRRKCFTRS